MTEEETRRKAALYQAMYLEAENERDVYAVHFSNMCHELMMMPHQSKRVENCVTKYRTSLERIWRGRTGNNGG